MDSQARNMRCKSWPYYKDWVTIFGKDRATGERAKGHPDHVSRQATGPTQIAGNDYLYNWFRICICVCLLGATDIA